MWAGLPCGGRLPAVVEASARIVPDQCGWDAQLLTAAQTAGVERFVYTSTVGCIGVPEGGIGDESQPCSVEQMAGDYKRSKFMAEQVALEFAREGLPVVIVNPTAPMGDHDFKPTPTGQIVLDFLQRRDAGVYRYRAERGRRADVALGHCWRASEEGGRALHSRLRESDAAEILDDLPTSAGGKRQRWSCRTSSPGRRCGHARPGRSLRERRRARRWKRADGEEEDVGFAREGGAELGMRRARARCACRAVTWFEEMRRKKAGKAA